MELLTEAGSLFVKFLTLQKVSHYNVMMNYSIYFKQNCLVDESPAYGGPKYISGRFSKTLVKRTSKRRSTYN